MSDDRGCRGEQPPVDWLGTSARVHLQALEFAAKVRYGQRLDFSAEMYWFFVEAEVALRCERFLASALCFFHGLESTVRWLHRDVFRAEYPDGSDLQNRKILSHAMLNELGGAGFRIETLAFPGESNFKARLATRGKSIDYIELLRERNNLAHGNASEHFRTSGDPGVRTFDLEHARDLAMVLNGISEAWTTEIQRWRQSQPRGAD